MTMQAEAKVMWRLRVTHFSSPFQFGASKKLGTPIMLAKTEHFLNGTIS